MAASCRISGRIALSATILLLRKLPRKPWKHGVAKIVDLEGGVAAVVGQGVVVTLVVGA